MKKQVGDLCWPWKQIKQQRNHGFSMFFTMFNESCLASKDHMLPSPGPKYAIIKKSRTSFSGKKMEEVPTKPLKNDNRTKCSIHTNKFHELILSCFIQYLTLRNIGHCPVCIVIHRFFTSPENEWRLLRPQSPWKMQLPTTYPGLRIIKHLG